jgi:Tol biopolymer transport system component
MLLWTRIRPSRRMASGFCSLPVVAARRTSTGYTHQCKGLEHLTDHPAFDDQAAMAPDGDRVAFVSSRSGQADIWKLDLKKKRLRNLTEHPAGDYRPA